MKINKHIYDKNYHEDGEHCICCGYEFEPLEIFYNLINVMSGGDTFICKYCLSLIKEDIIDYERQDNI